MGVFGVGEVADAAADVDDELWGLLGEAVLCAVEIVVSTYFRPIIKLSFRKSGYTSKAVL